MSEPRPVIEIIAKPHRYRTRKGHIVGMAYEATGPDGRAFSSSNLRNLSSRLRAEFPGHSVRVIDGRSSL